MENRLETGQRIHGTVENQTIRQGEGRESPTTQEAVSEHQTTILEEALATPDPTVPIHRAQTDHLARAIAAIKALVVQETAEMNLVQPTNVETIQASLALR